MGALELVVWDKDTFGKDYLGEVALPIQDWFQGQPILFDDPVNEVGQDTGGASLTHGHSRCLFSLSQCLWYLHTWTRRVQV